MQSRLITILDYFYPPFRKMMPVQIFRYAACGGLNTLLDIFLYYICFHYVLDEKVLHLSVVAISPWIAAFLLSFLVSFPLGFYLNRNLVFPGSSLRGRVQLMRYLLLVIVCIALNYIFIKLFVEQFDFYPTIAKILTTVIVVSFSYLTQKHFTFRTGTTGRQTEG